MSRHCIHDYTQQMKVETFSTRDIRLSWKVRIFVAAELSTRAYADHPILQDTLASKKTFTDRNDTLFSLLMSDEFDIGRNREDAIIYESMKTCEDKSWSSMLHLLGFV